jgi:hypothetical protein
MDGNGFNSHSYKRPISPPVRLNLEDRRTITNGFAGRVRKRIAKHADEHPQCPLIEVDRKWLAEGQTGAIGPKGDIVSNFQSTMRLDNAAFSAAFVCRARGRFPSWFYETRFTPGGCHVPSPGGRIEGASVFGQ